MAFSLHSLQHWGHIENLIIPRRLCLETLDISHWGKISINQGLPGGGGEWTSLGQLKIAGRLVFTCRLSPWGAKEKAVSTFARKAFYEPGQFDVDSDGL